MFLLSFLIVTLALVIHHVYIHEELPRAAALTPVWEFSAERAQPVVEGLVRCGLRNVGTPANERCAVNFLLDHLNALKHNTSLTVDLIQGPADLNAFHVDFIGGIVSAYRNLSNIVATLRVPRSPAHAGDAGPRRILINAHFDSALGTTGASDNAAQVGLAVEVLRALLADQPSSEAPAPSTGGRSIEYVFLLNGAEETILQGAHAYVSSLTAAELGDFCGFVNLEAAGAGGKEILFQLRSLWQAEAYARATKGRASASSLFQALFSTGVIPAETDYKVLNAHIPAGGFDLAQISNGFVYHTARDDLGHVDWGTVQRFGDNVLALVKELARSPGCVEGGPGSTAGEVVQPETAIFFDFLGAITVVYGVEKWSFFLCTFTSEIVVVLLMFWQRPRLGLILGVLGTIVLGVLGGLVYPMLAVIFGKYMCYFSVSRVVIALLFIAPAISLSLLGLHIFVIRGDHSVSLRKSVFMHIRTLFAILTIVLTLNKSPASYLPLLWTACPLLGWMVMSESLSLVVSYFVPLVITLQAFLPLFTELLIPVSGRMGTLVAPELIFGLGLGTLTTLVILGMADVFVPVHHSKMRRFSLALFTIFAISAGLVLTLVHPYSPTTPKRLFFQEAEQLLAPLDSASPGSSSGATEAGRVERFLVVAPVDYNRLWPLGRGGVPSRRQVTQSEFRVKEDFIHEGFLPHYFPLADFVQHMEVFSGNLSRPLSDGLRVTDEVTEGGGVRRLSVRVETQGQVTVVTIPGEGLVRWSLTPELPKVRKDCGCHFVKFAQGGEDEWKTMSFWFEVEEGKKLRTEISTHFTGDFPRPDLEKLANELGVDESIAPVFFSTAGVEIKK